MALLIKSGKLVERGGLLMTNNCCGYWSMEFVWEPSCADGVWGGAWTVLVDENFTQSLTPPLPEGDNYNEDGTGCLRVGAQTCDNTTSNITTGDPATDPTIAHTVWFYALYCYYDSTGYDCDNCWGNNTWYSSSETFEVAEGTTPAGTLTNEEDCYDIGGGGGWACHKKIYKTSYVGPYCTLADAEDAATAALGGLTCP